MKIKDWHKEAVYFIITLMLLLILIRNYNDFMLPDGILPNTTSGKGGMFFLIFLNKIGGKYLVFALIILVGFFFLRRAIIKFKNDVDKNKHS